MADPVPLQPQLCAGTAWPARSLKPTSQCHVLAGCGRARRCAAQEVQWSHTCLPGYFCHCCSQQVYKTIVSTNCSKIMAVNVKLAKMCDMLVICFRSARIHSVCCMLSVTSLPTQHWSGAHQLWTVPDTAVRMWTMHQSRRGTLPGSFSTRFSLLVMNSCDNINTLNTICTHNISLFKDDLNWPWLSDAMPGESGHTDSLDSYDPPFHPRLTNWNAWIRMKHGCQPSPS